MKGMMMKKTIFVLMAAVSVTTSYSAMAEDSEQMMPPPGPYQLNESEELRGSKHICEHKKAHKNYSQAPSQQPNRAVPQWVKQQQAQRGQWMQPPSMQVPQARVNQQRPNWNYHQGPQNYNQAPPMMNPNRGGNVQPNPMQQYFPYARGPVYGPSVPPTEFGQQPRYPSPRFQNN